MTPEPVALLRADSCRDPDLANKIGFLLDAAAIPVRPGMTVLVKPNLLLDLPLACTSPEIVAAACGWLLDHRTKPVISDSPAFGTARSVARAIGLSDCLQKLGLEVRNFGKCERIRLDLPGRRWIGIAREALECDLILSVPRIKAHSQMRITLAVKNCFGCVTGLRKAVAHVEFGRSVDYFADMIAAVWAALPGVAGLCDGITAMSVTGPRNGVPVQLGILAASRFAPALDLALLRLLRLAPETSPMQAALMRRQIMPDLAYPLAKPDSFHAQGFEAPKKLKEISFNPLRLALSLVKRAALNLAR